MTHRFLPMPPADPFSGDRWCRCGRKEKNRIHDHDEPDTPDLAAIRVGESLEEDH